jgi:hypothetical protein
LEVEILLDLMLARLCTSITVQTWRAKLYPENSDYLLVHNSYSKRTLKYVTSCKHDEISARIREICRI